MNLDNLNKWLTLTANVGVLIGILFLAIELRENSKATMADVYQSRALEVASIQFELSNSDQIAELVLKSGRNNIGAGLAAVNEFTAIERYRLERYLDSELRLFDNNLYQCSLGYHDTDFCTANANAVNMLKSEMDKVGLYVNPIFTQIHSLQEN